MAEAHESVSEVAEEDEKKSRRRIFGRRKEDPKEIRSESEWVDTLTAAEGDDEPPLAGSPFAAEDDDEDAAGLPEAPEVSETPTFAGAGFDDEGLPQEAAEVGDEVVIRERSLYRPDKLALENRVRASHQHRGESDAFYEKSWTRRTAESMEDIHNYIDNVIGTDIDPSRRRERYARAGKPVAAGERAATVHVEGLEQDIMLAFSFPREEFRAARVVYETEGGYVVEVTRAVGNDDNKRETQYYTVSRVGEIGHVLDKMRAREAERVAREQGAGPTAPVEGPGPDTYTEPVDTPPGPEDVGAPGATDADKAPEESPDAATDAPEPPQWQHDAPAPQVETEPPAPVPGSESAAPEAEDDEETGKKGRFGLFKRKGDDDKDDDAEADADAADADDDAGKKGRFGLFKRKGDDAEAETDASGEAEPESDADADGGKRRGIGGLLKRKKDDDGEESS